MVATVQIRRLTGVSTSQTSSNLAGGNTRANAFDTHSTADTSNPVQKPTSGSKYSYWVTTRLNCTVTPSGTIDNLRWFADGTNNFGTGITCNGQTATSYVQATGTPGDTGTQLTTGNHSGLTAAPVDVFTFNSTSPKSMTGSINNPSTGEFGDYFVYQIAVTTAVSAGASAQETFTFRYDET
jgi:hypothetical protein